MLNFARLEDRVALDEGFRGFPYLDTVGVWTIGYGTTRINNTPVTGRTERITESFARTLLRGDLYEALIDCQGIYSNFDDLHPVRQEVLANMAYNLGRAGLFGFRKMNKAVVEGDISQWCAEMQDSRWHAQVGDRAHRLVQAVRTAEWA